MADDKVTDEQVQEQIKKLKEQLLDFHRRVSESCDSAKIFKARVYDDCLTMENSKRVLLKK